jgi:predicted transcriptional regulator
VSFTKARDLGEEDLKPFSLHFFPQDDKWMWESEDNKEEATNHRRIEVLRGLHEGKTQKDIADKLGITQQGVSTILDKLVRNDLYDRKKKKITREGHEMLQVYDNIND